MLSTKLSTLLAVIFIFLLSLGSFQFNALHVASDTYFQSHQVDSEQYVLDGITHAKITNSSPILGRYTRPELKNEIEHYEKAHQLFNIQDASGEFAPYRSQYGLQAYFFYFMHKVFNASIFSMQFISSVFMSVVVAGFFWALRKEFSFLGSLVFCLSLITSQWVVVFARNLFWVEATWFLPMLAALALGKMALDSFRHRVFLSIILFFCFFIKFLCGYEYITTIFISTLAPLVFLHLKYSTHRKYFLYLVLSITTSLLFAIVLAFSFQASKVSSNFSDGLTYIRTIAEKNTMGKDPKSIAEAACSDKFMSIVNRESCLEEYVNSLTVGHQLVIRRYFYFPHFLPWIDNLQPHPNTNRILEIRLGWSSVYAFYILLILTGIMIIKKRKSSAWSTLIILSFISPLSWYFFAKGHSYIHRHLNFVLWYLPFIPFSMLFFIESTSKLSANTDNLKS